MQGKVTNTGVFGAKITFSQPVDVFWTPEDDGKTNLQKIGTFQLRTLNAAGGEAKLNQSSVFAVEQAFGDFAAFLLTQPEFEWTLKTGGVNVLALGFLKANGLSMTKRVKFEGINNFFPSDKEVKDGTASKPRITGFDLPSDATNGEGIQFQATAVLFNPSPFAVQLGTLELDFLGSAASTSSVSLVPGNNSVPVTGSLVPQNTTAGLSTMSGIFSAFLAGEESAITAKNLRISEDVSWLNEGMKALQIDTTLKAEKSFEVVKSLSLDSMSVTMLNDGDAYAPGLGSDVSSTYQNPFGFSLQPLSIALTSTLTRSNQSIATLSVPLTKVSSAGTSTGDVQPLAFSFTGQSLVAIKGAESNFDAFFRTLTNTDGVTVGLGGNVSVLARTKIGDVTIQGIPLVNLQTRLKGINGFAGKAEIDGTPVVLGSGNSGGEDFIRIQTNVVLNNPSDISLQSKGVSFDVAFKGTKIGTAVVDTLALKPGKNTLAAELHYAPDDPSDPNGLELLNTFIQTTNTIPISITGSSSSSPFSSLSSALQPLSMDSSFAGIGQKLLTNLDVFLNLENAACNADTSLTFSVDNNAAQAPLIFEQVSFNGVLKGCPVASGTHDFSTQLVAQPTKEAYVPLCIFASILQQILKLIWTELAAPRKWYKAYHLHKSCLVL
ncbi:hypothetical protein BT69DRAFT_11228 [Atractiella rhizophila]|nr:hypothetical protein BT69DRAFT_11228 [Atractiella rhizophila]